jgi:AcrR family transcriptional regulator
VPPPSQGAVARAEKSHVALLRSAQTVFAERGYAAASTEEIARTAGVSKSLIYRHFGNKAKLFGVAVVEPFLSFLDEFAADWEAEFSATQPVEATTERFISVLYQRMCGARPMLAALLSVSLQSTGPGADLLAIRPPLERLFERVTEEHHKTAARYGISGIDPPLTVRTTFGLVFALAVMDGWLLGSMDTAPDPARVASQLSEFVTAGVTRRTPGAADIHHSLARNAEAGDGAHSVSAGDSTGSGSRERRSWGTAPPEMLEAAAELFAEKGYTATSTKEVALRCGVSESLLFWHFPTKDTLFLRSVFEPFMRSLEAFADEWDRRDRPDRDTVEDAAHTFILRLHAWIRGERRLLVAMINVDILGSHPGAAFPEIRGELRRLFELLEAEHVRVRELYGHRPLDPAVIVRLTFGAVLAVVVFDDWLFAGVDPPPSSERLQDELVAYLSAVTSRK